MITKEQERTVVTNVNNSSNFTIQNSAKMFRIISSGIYADPIRAIIRELSCNAYDSHIDAGKKDVKFTVRLPSRFDPKLQIEDYGIGLDHEGVTELYPVYGLSTKTESNDVIGALGFGSKTPFAYSETFTVRARKDGIERWYNAYIGNEGFPTISLLSERATDECNGVMIEVAVKDADCGRFREKAHQVFKHFKIVPDGLPDNMGDVIREKSASMYQAFDTDGFYMDRNSDRGIHAVMGNIAYRIPDNLIQDVRGDLHNYLCSRYGQDYCIYLPFGIGELDIAASRETLSFSETDDDPTYMAILAKLDTTLGVYLKEIQEDLDACPTWVEACQYINTNRLSIVAGMFTYQGVTMDMVRRSRIQLDVLFHHRTSWSSTIFNQYRNTKHEIRLYNTDGRFQSDRDVLSNGAIAESDGLVVLYNDKEDSRGVPTAIRWYVDQYGARKYVIGAKHTISKHTIKRIKERVPNVVFLPLSPIIAERKASMEKNRLPKHESDQYQKDSEVKARYFNGNQNCALKILDIDELRERGTRVAYYQPANPRVVSEWTILGKQFGIHHWNSSLMKFMGVDIVLYANQSNIKRILNNNVPNIEDVVKARIPLMQRIVDSLLNVENSLSLDDFLSGVRHAAILRGTSTIMDRFAVHKLYERGHIQFHEHNDVSKDRRFLGLMGARYYTGKGYPLATRIDRGYDRINYAFSSESRFFVNLFTETPDTDNRRDIYTAHAKVLESFTNNTPILRHLNPQFDVNDVKLNEGAQEFVKFLDKLVDDWASTSV